MTQRVERGDTLGTLLNLLRGRQYAELVYVLCFKDQVLARLVTTYFISLYLCNARLPSFRT
jgi:hypothetical protein